MGRINQKKVVGDFACFYSVDKKNRLNKVAGKTGTAETTGGLNNSWFTGFAPADDPQIAIAVVYEDMDATTGSQLSTNAGKQLFEAVLNK